MDSRRRKPADGYSNTRTPEAPKETRMAVDYLTTIQESADFVRSRTRLVPRVCIILGTGLGDFQEGELEVDARISYAEIPHFPHTGVEGHAGEMVIAKFHGKPVVIMRGRVHAYEGYRLREVGYPVRVMKALGVDTLVLTNAVGGLNPNFRAGTMMVVTDHINLMGDNPLVGPNDDRLGDRFPDMSEPYDRALVAQAEAAALKLGLRLERGVYVSVLGPNLETAAEYRFLRGIGADVVGMSLIGETITAVHGKQKVLAISVVTDMCLPDQLKPASIPEILRVAGEIAPSLMRLLGAVVDPM